MAATKTERAIWKALAITAVLAVLGLILFPTFSGPPRYALRTACVSNMKQISLGLLLYTYDNTDRLPVLQSPAGPTAIGWAGRITPYTKNGDLFVDREETKNLDEAEKQRPRVSYAMNANATALPNAATIPPESAARSVLVYEVSNARQGRGGELASTLALSPVGDGTANGLLDTIDPNVPPLVRPATGPLDNSGLDPKSVGRHEGTSNFGFLDMHAKSHPPSAVSAGANAAKASNPQVHRGCRRPDLPGIDRPCAEGAGNGTHRATFSLK